MAATDKQEGNKLITHWLKRYKARYDTQPRGFNRHALSYGFTSLWQDYNVEAVNIIDYYFDNYSSHNPTQFVYNYGEIFEAMQDAKDDAIARRELRARTKERMKNVINSRKGTESGSPQ